VKEKIICVEWDDACFNSGMYDREDTKRFTQLRIKSVGHLIKSTPKEIIIGTDCWHDFNVPVDYRHITTIPKKMIVRITKLSGGVK